MAEGTLREQGARQAGRPAGPHGHGPGGRMAPGEKPKDFGGTMRKLLHYMGTYRVGLIAAVALAMASVLFSVVGPKVLGGATTEVIRGAPASTLARSAAYLLACYAYTWRAPRRRACRAGS